MKKCSKCKEVKEELNFCTNKRRADNLSIYCKSCERFRRKEWKDNNKEHIKNYNKIYMENNPDYYKEYAKEYRKTHLDNYKEYGLRQRFGINLEIYNEMFQLQNGCCAICGKHQSEFKSALAVDHDHKTGKIRGLLCINCNTGLGRFYDSSDLLRTAIDYLKGIRKCYHQN